MLHLRHKTLILSACVCLELMVVSVSSTGQQWGTHSPTNMHLIRGQSSERHIGSGGTVSVFPDYLSSAAALQVILDSTHCWCHGLNQQLLLLSDILPNSGSHAKRERERERERNCRNQRLVVSGKVKCGNRGRRGWWKTLKDKRRIKKKMSTEGRRVAWGGTSCPGRKKKINKCSSVNSAWVVNGMIQAH